VVASGCGHRAHSYTVGVREELTEPWGIVTAAVLGGLGAAVTAALAPAAVLAVPVGLGIAGAVYGVRVVVGALSDRSRAPAPRPLPPGLPVPPRGSPADRWLRRAQAAVEALHRQTESPSDPVLRGQVADTDDRAAAAVDDLRRLAGQVTLVEQALARMDPQRLAQDARALRAAVAAAGGEDLREERRRALRAVTDQQDVAERLSGTREGQLARMQSTVLGLEGLVARLAELLAMHASSATADDTAARLGALTDELDGLRAGLAETEAISRRVLATEREGPARDASA
jgi:hypothetical protein